MISRFGDRDLNVLITESSMKKYASNTTNINEGELNIYWVVITKCFVPNGLRTF